MAIKGCHQSSLTSSPRQLVHTKKRSACRSYYKKISLSSLALLVVPQISMSNRICTWTKTVPLRYASGLIKRCVRPLHTLQVNSTRSDLRGRFRSICTFCYKSPPQTKICQLQDIMPRAGPKLTQRTLKIYNKIICSPPLLSHSKLDQLTLLQNKWPDIFSSSAFSYLTGSRLNLKDLIGDLKMMRFVCPLSLQNVFRTNSWWHFQATPYVVDSSPKLKLLID